MISLILLMASVFHLNAHNSSKILPPTPKPTLGNYPNTSIIAGSNAKIIPNKAPTYTFRSVAYTSTNFSGILTVDPITGVVTVTDAKLAGIYTVTVKVFNIGAQAASTIFKLTVNNPVCSQGLLIYRFGFLFGSLPVSVAVGDFDGDGKQDIATANYSDNTVSIKPGDGSGQFGGNNAIPVGALPVGLAIGDFNGDGKQDFAVTSESNKAVSIRLGNGIGGFISKPDVPVGLTPFSVAIGDFNGDGKQDLATTNANNNTVHIRLGDGSGGFITAADVSVGLAPYSVAIGDFNKDGKQDLTTANYLSNSISIRLGDGNGNFITSPDVTVGSGPSSVSIGDFNGDGKQDIATNCQDNNLVSIRLGDGSGGFSGNNNVPVGSNPRSLAIGDFNGDGKQDIVTTNFQANTISIRLGDGLGGFNGNTNLSVPAFPRSVAIGDFNGDNKQDIVTANGTIAILLGEVDEINVKGNNVFIFDGDNTPSISDHSDFGNVAMGNTLVRTFTIQNTGTTALTVKSIAPTGPDASLFKAGILTPASPIAAGSSASFNLTFTPTSTGLKSAAVHIANDDCDESDYDFAVQGNCVCPIPVFSTCPLAQSVNLPNGGCSTTVSYIATTTHILSPTLTYSFTGATTAAGNGSGSGSAFNIGLTNVTIKATNTCLASATCLFTITVNAPEIELQGLGTSILDGDNTPAAIDGTNFGNVNIGSNSVRTFTIRNTGLANLSVGAITRTGPNANLFTLGTLSPASPIPPSGSAIFSVTFTPTSAGLKSTTIHIANNDCNEADYDFVIGGTSILLPLPTFGNYPNTSLTAGSNTKIIPGIPPTNTLSAVAYTNTNFTGTFAVDPITGVVTVTDAKQAGVYNVSVKAFGYGFQVAYTYFTLTVTDPLCSQGLFFGNSYVPTGTRPISIAIGDFNGDGNQDFATANLGSVSIRLGDGTGGFLVYTEVLLPIGPIPRSITIGDFNKDGNQDLAISMEIINLNGQVSILLGDGLGGFSGNTEVPVGFGPSSIAVGDFNGDGNQDIANANRDGNTVSIRLGDGLGGFNGNAEISVGLSPISLVIGDFDGDGKQDFATANITSNTVSIRLGHGNQGLFKGNTEVPVGNTPWSIAVGDFDRDGKQDFATANSGSNTISIRMGYGNQGQFKGNTDFPVGGFNPTSLAIADFDGNSIQDIATSNSANNTVSINFGYGNGTFTGFKNFYVGNNPFSLVIGDFNTDGIHDIATANLNSNFIFTLFGGMNEINVSGNSNSISDGDNTPYINDHTDFGSVASNTTVVRTFTIQNSGATELAINAITVIGGDASLFTIGALNPSSPIAAGGSANFTVSFASSIGGLKTTTLHMANDDCDEGDYDFAIAATVQAGDNKKPTPLCKSGITLIIDNNGQVTIMAKDMDAGSYDDITSSANLVISFDSAGTQTTKIFSCADGQEFPYSPFSESYWRFKMYVMDEAGNSDYCYPEILLQDPAGICQPIIHPLAKPNSNLNSTRNTINNNRPDLSIRPNPTFNSVYVLVPPHLLKSGNILRLTAIDGRIVKSVSVEANGMNIDVSLYSSGLYFLSLYDSQGRMLGQPAKLVKQ